MDNRLPLPGRLRLGTKIIGETARVAPATTAFLMNCLREIWFILSSSISREPPGYPPPFCALCTTYFRNLRFLLPKKYPPHPDRSAVFDPELRPKGAHVEALPLSFDPRLSTGRGEGREGVIPLVAAPPRCVLCVICG